MKPGEPAKRKAPATVTEAVERGSLREQYVAMRSRIARAIDAPDIRGADLAALSRRLHELTKEIEALDARDLEEGGGGAGVPDEEFDAEAL